MSLTKKWSDSQSESSMTNKLFDRLKPQDPLKPRNSLRAYYMTVFRCESILWIVLIHQIIQ